MQIIPLSSSESNGLSVHEKKFKIDFQDNVNLRFLIRMILATFDLQVTLILSTNSRQLATDLNYFS